ncbi:MAG: hypothetical protein NDJ89_13370 [Oligoflexia bacterium]|nr:hypothetical protein [Oligoflexia bacterium]
MRLLWLGLFVFGSCANAFAAFEEAELARLDDSRITFYLDRPSSQSTYPILLFLQGSECRSIRSRSFMPENPASLYGVGIVLIEKYGITHRQNSENDSSNCTTEYRQGNTLDQRLTDALQVIAHLRKAEPGWNRKLIILGGSEGAALAPLVGALTPETAKVAMLAGGNGRLMLEDMRESLELTARANKLPEEQLKELLMEFDQKVLEIKAHPRTDVLYLGQSGSELWSGCSAALGDAAQERARSVVV